MNKTLIKILPFAGLALGAVTDLVIPDSELQPPADHPYFLYFLGLLAVVYGILFIASFISAKLDERISYKAPLIAGTAVLITVINLITSKYALLPVLFFPCLDRVFGVFVTDYELLIQCILASGQLLLRGFLAGGILGFLTGILIGFNKKASYWISPFMKFVGPIPPTSWSPLVLSLFTTTYSASVFMVALAVWFPITLMTSSGIQNVNNSYFEVASTLGSGKLNKIFKVAVPAAMPSIFLGIFYATCSAFVTLVTAELLGADAGLGWYLNWEKSMMLYANVYAGLILIAVICTMVITLVFKIKDQVLVWQRGVIKW
ncbi:ABC transporter permease [Blautia ammoniilytica]|uniref:ABC transporter permease subunit n=1 Tax=Blautia ammoniilytica TaxID=2981782 RepID=A0ABT2TU09_9FIRM|nr:ABC transporter permease subunit [Blautia ammoniilytica]MCU6765251.1 ABC transporter permease subunit [Blautia ammoniilytica]SCH93366.1 Bicarbonate transport system permease protein CmpB [uncultured Blautia sp.]